MGSEYRQSVDAFLRATEWVLDDPHQKRRIEDVLRWFNSCGLPAAYMDAPVPIPDKIKARMKPGDRIAHRPANSDWTNLMSWMQCINFHYPVFPNYPLEAGRCVLRFGDAPADPADPKFGNFYAEIDHGVKFGRKPTNHGYGIPSSQRFPAYYTVTRRTDALKTTAGDAFMGWNAYRRSYAKGGKAQIFVPGAKDVLKPEFES